VTTVPTVNVYDIVSVKKFSRLVRKGLLTNEDVLEEIKLVRREMEGRIGR
jgi:hypothetical protein